jgi:hypothetical protein
VESDIGDKEAFISRAHPSFRAGDFDLISYRVEHAGDDFETHVLLVSQVVSAPPDDPDLQEKSLLPIQSKI